MSQETSLRQSGRFVRRALTAYSIRLNTVRNELIYTHGAACPHPEQLSSMLLEVWKMIELIEGSSRWTTAARDLFEPPQLDELAIFDALADVSTFVEEISLS